MSVDWAHILLLLMFGLIWVCVFQLVGRKEGVATQTARRKTTNKRPLGKM
ncbi:MAG: hypothetical protein Q8M16_10555 [Pirellulaceae bacterium]|nr:hypothetical protein [Pirellulaceae bacterium]